MGARNKNKLLVGLIIVIIIPILCLHLFYGRTHKMEMAMWKCSFFRGDSCSVDLKKDLPFKWDSLFYFGYECSPEVVEDISGIDFGQEKAFRGFIGEGDLREIIVFKNKGKLAYAQSWIYQEIDFYNVVVFMLPHDRPYVMSMSCEDAKFTLRHYAKAFILTNDIITPPEVLQRDWSEVKKRRYYINPI